MKTRSMLLGLLVIFLTTTGCAVGRKMSYKNEQVKPDYKSTHSITIAFQDQRPEVLNKKQLPSYCGYTGSTAQIQYNVQTESGEPLAEEFTQSVTASLKDLGINANSMTVTLNTPTDSILSTFANGDKERLLLFTIQEWQASSMPKFSSIRYEIKYAISLSVYNRTGRMLAASSVHDDVIDEHGQISSMKQLQEMADEVFRTQIKNLLNNDAVKTSLTQNTPSAN